MGINICIHTLRKDFDQSVSHRQWWEGQELKGGGQRLFIYLFGCTGS